MGDIHANSANKRDVHELVSNSSLIDFLNNEENCEEKIDSLSETELFSEISRLASLNNRKLNGDDDDRTIEELLKEAETLINQPIGVETRNVTISCESTPKEIKEGFLDQYDYSTVKSLSHHDVSKKSLYLNFRYSIGNNFNERHRFLTCAENLVSWQHETMTTGVSKLNCKRILEFQCSFCPIVTAT